jgi:hypothetical protein
VVLQPSDAEELLAWRARLGPNDLQANALTDWLAAGAARLQPDKAAGLLVPLLKRGGFPDAALELWRTCGMAQSDRLLDWFYLMPPGKGLSQDRRDFLDFLFTRFRADDRRWLARMLLDKRYEQLYWSTLRYVASGLNRNVMPAVIPADEMEREQSWLEEAIIENQADALEKYPERIARLLAVLPEWRKRIRESVKSWAPPSP